MERLLCCHVAVREFTMSYQKVSRLKQIEYDRYIYSGTFCVPSSYQTV
uniref:Uncharacterized protein n=1 Tax=Caudovirales sp. ctIZM3 TaxID=2827633 RepID=A0A8S5T886_9CAUD|nr:MAG TPA: hypothetical protein [Caudovirales sp. ctIZM3]